MLFSNDRRFSRKHFEDLVYPFPITMTATKTKAMKAKAMKAKATKAKASNAMKAKAAKAQETRAKAAKRPASTSIPRPTAVSQVQPWDKLKMSRDTYMFWQSRGVDPSDVEAGAPMMGVGFNG